MDVYHHIANSLLHSRYAIALTGAGISVESGIPDFRSEKGLWSKYDPMEFGHIESFRDNPAKVWIMLQEMDELLRNAHPNPAHYALAELERHGILKSVITQNVDSLHQRAGSQNVIEFHGHGRTLRCDLCEKRFTRDAVTLAKLPPFCNCGGVLRPDFVFFGEYIPPEAHELAMSAARSSDLLLMVGTSATVAPASHLPYAAKDSGAAIIEINPQQTDLSQRMIDIRVAEPAGKALPGILSALKEISHSTGEKN